MWRESVCVCVCVFVCVCIPLHASTFSLCLLYINSQIRGPGMQGRDQHKQLKRHPSGQIS